MHSQDEYEYSLRCAERDLAEYKRMGYKHYLLCIPYDENTCTNCRVLSGRPLPVSEAKIGVNYPPFGPQCRSTTIPIFSWDLNYLITWKRSVRIHNGKIVQVPAYMSYKEWKAWQASGEPEINIIDFYYKYIQKYRNVLTEES